MIEKYFILPIQEKEQDHRGNKNHISLEMCPWERDLKE